VQDFGGDNGDHQSPSSQGEIPCRSTLYRIRQQPSAHIFALYRNYRFASLNLGHLATSFCLLRLPKMPELSEALQKHKGKLPNFTPAGREIDIFAIPYKDKIREKARQKRLKEELERGGKTAKQMKLEQKQAEKEMKDKERRESAVAKGRNPDKKRGKNARIADDWDELAKEERLFKKLRRHAISQQEFDDQING
jgi:ATP-dependent RNA helicase DDX55/SPB4